MLTVGGRIGCLEHRRVNIRSRTFLAGLDAVFNDQGGREGGIELSIRCSDHRLDGAMEMRRGGNRQIKAWRVEGGEV